MPWLHALIDVPDDRLGTTADFWGRALGWPTGQPWEGHAELRSFEPPDGSSYVHLQEIGGPPRVHLDVESPDPATTVEQARGLGATFVADHGMWRSMTSPGGLPFCVVRTGPEERPDAVTWPTGHRTRLVQLCVDSPVVAHDRAVQFWRALLGGRWVDSRHPEFAGKWHDDAGSPLQLLFQRLDEPEGPVRVHLDVGTDDMDAEIVRLVALGAEDVGPGHGGWHVLRDPVGQVFCVTSNSPEPTTHRDLD